MPENTLLPPQDLSAEKGLLGSVMLIPDCIDLCVKLVQPRMFYLADHGQIFQSMLSMRQDGVAIDAITIIARLKHDCPQKEESGWSALLEEAVGSVPHAAHAESYARQIAECWRKRELIYWGTGVAERAYSAGYTSEELIGEATASLQEITDAGREDDRTIAMDFMELTNELGTERVPGIPSGFIDLDARTNGFQKSEVIVVAARSGTGKTAWVCNLILNAAGLGSRVLFISLEQSRKEIVARFAAMHARVSSDKIRKGTLDQQEVWEIKRSASEVSQYPIEIIDTAGQTVGEIAAAARLAKLRRGLDLVVIDYLQFVKPADARMPREQQVAAISREIKNTAKQLDVPIVVLAQMSRDIEKREDKTPRMSDLRESGAIEQDADIIMFLDRPGSWDKNADQSEASLIIRKFRNGNPGTVPLHWDGSCMLFQNAALGSQVGADPFSGGGFTTWDPFRSDTQGDF